MFFHVELQKNVLLPPRAFGPNLIKTVLQRLRQEVEGSCTGRHGYIVLVTTVSPGGIGPGVLQPTTGLAKYDVTYRCLVFKPLKGEVLDAVVTSVSKFGFFADAGPMQLFVSNYHIPEDMKFTADDEPCFVTDDGQVRVVTGSEVRLRIVGTRHDGVGIFGIGSMKGDFLGLIGES